VYSKIPPLLRQLMGLNQAGLTCGVDLLGFLLYFKFVSVTLGGRGVPVVPCTRIKYETGIK
jgi:hypothetical protein